MEGFSESRSHKHLLTTQLGEVRRPSSMWSGGFRSRSGLLPGPGIARKSVAPPTLLFFVLGGFWSHLLCRVLFFWSTVVFVLLLFIGLFPEVPGRADPQLRKRPWPPHGGRGGIEMAMARLHVGVCCFPFPSFFPHAVQCWASVFFSSKAFSRQTELLQPQPRGSRREGGSPQHKAGLSVVR